MSPPGASPCECQQKADPKRAELSDSPEIPQCGRSFSAGDPSVRERVSSTGNFCHWHKKCNTAGGACCFWPGYVWQWLRCFQKWGVPRPHFLSFSITSFPSGPHPVIQPGNLRSAISSPASLGGARDRQTLYYAFRAENHAFNWWHKSTINHALICLTMECWIDNVRK